MRIIVCVKGVLNVTSLKMDFRAQAPDPKTRSLIPNPCDLVAIEAALQIQERLGDGKIVLMTVGPPESEPVFRKYLALGVDEGIRIWDTRLERVDSYITSSLLASAIKRVGYDLILCGRESPDTTTAQIGPRIAELLDLPHVSGIADLTIGADGREAWVKRKLEKGDREEVYCPLPALFTVDPALNHPRYPTFPQRRRARRMEITCWTGEDLDLVSPAKAFIDVRSLTPPRPRPKKIITPSSNLPAMERIRLLMSGGISDKKSSEIIEDSAEVAASRIIDFLYQEKIISND